MKSFIRKSKKNGLIRYIILTVMAIYTLFPISFLVINSFKSQSEIVKTPLALPKSLNFTYIINAIKEIDLANSIWLTVLITVVAVTLIVIISSSVAWMMVRYKSNVSSFMLLFFTSSMLIPFQAVMYPLISLFDNVGLKNVVGLILMYGGFGMSMSIFLYHGFMKSVPVALEEAAIIDGASVFQVYFKVIMPLVRPTTMTVIIMNAMWIWNDYLLPFLVIGNGEQKTLTLSIYFAKIQSGQYGNAWDLIFPAVLITIIPIIILFLILQKNIIRGISDGAVK
ncbi:sugar ABC transporter permease [Enterococcus saigonensis]|uniref:Sugar ABC transporter permease n=1 Tax=Enterococcus saigonensis TaxID=1805431 RepID=A0A679I9A8_9ENTE|nr:carbohydrate ABC transporter permease [Enterococcus saigonensis]BCA86208.1 sugar ABC transporter permease [Enterococcus saigonensis]